MFANNDAEQIRQWLEGVIKQTGLKPTPLAKEAGLAPSTLLRALDPDNPTALERRSIAKIVARFNVAPPFAPGAAPAGYPPGFSEDELLAPEDDAPVFEGAHLTPNQYVRTINTRALELAGYLPGDVALFDMSVTARDGDAVAANVYNLQGGADTVLRIFEPPYLVTRTMDREIASKPRLVDGEHVRIMAVLVKLIRGRS